MSTRGIFGLRKNETDKTTYNHYDSYPKELGKNIVDLCRRTSLEAFDKAFDNIVLVDEIDKATPEQIKVVPADVSDFSIGSGQEDDWHCLLANANGKLEAYTEQGLTFMMEYSDFIKMSLFCEWGYIVNLDTGMLEVWKGLQKTPDSTNRYGTECDEGYYPCRLINEIPLSTILGSTEIIDLIKQD
jgi:hypothetical protein